MPKAKQGKQGGKNARRGKNTGEENKRDLQVKEECQAYGQVLRLLGNGRLEAQCFDGVKRLAHIRGKLKNKVWIGVGDVLLLGLREFQDSKCDVILRYTPEEARNLKQHGEISSVVRINENVMDFEAADEGCEEEGGFTFDSI
jgi:translation initiation factor 1A